MRIRLFLFGLTLAVLLVPSSGLTQFGPGGGPPGGGGGGRGGGGFRMDPSAMWDRMAKGKDSVTRADLSDQFSQMIFDRTVQAAGITNGVLTKQQYLEQAQAFMQRMGRGSNRGGRGGMPPGGMPGQTPDQRRQPGSGGDPAEAQFRKLDINGDGVLNTDEMPEDLKVVKDQYANRDGVVDLNGFKEFTRSKGQQGFGGNWIGGQEETPEEEEKRPVVFHAGNLPKELLAGGKAAWFQELDKDEDAQIGLYEWKDSGRSIEEFQKIDRNGDGYLTVEEVLYYLAQQDKATAKAKGKSGSSAATASAGRGGPEGFRPGGGPPAAPVIGTPTGGDSSAPSFAPPGGSPSAQDRGGAGQRRRGGQGRQRPGG
ncbi:MAG: hypothetical protein ACJ8FY_16385 [Gemmataceae bacterium]